MQRIALSPQNSFALGPAWARGPILAQLGPCTWKSKSRPKWRNLGPFGDSIAPSWIDSKKTRKIVKPGVLRISDWVGYVNLDRSCSKWVQLGPKAVASWIQAGPKLECVRVGPCWQNLTTNRANVADMLDRNRAFGRFCADLLKICRLLQSRALFGGLLCSPPAEVVPVTSLTDLSVSLTAKLPPQHLRCGWILSLHCK
jgi:hypothetical protein